MCRVVQKTILITGGSGFIGSHLAKYLQAQGYAVSILTRNTSPNKNVNPHISMITSLDNADIEYDIIINLAGESIAQRWTRNSKERIVDSRIDMTDKIIAYIQKSSKKPELLISGSAIGIYGISKHETFTETSPITSSDFTAHVCKLWEDKALEAEAYAVRVVLLRTGIVLGQGGGALSKMLTPFKLGLGGKMGSGSQMMSWIDIQDLVGIVNFTIEHQDIHGSINAVSPNPVNNATFTKTLAHILNRPSFFTMPSFVIKLIFGKEMPSELLVNGQSVSADKVSLCGYKFAYPTLEESLERILQKGDK